MWVYSTTTATEAHAWQVTSTATGSTFSSSRDEGFHYLSVVRQTSSSVASSHMTPFETLRVHRSFYTYNDTFTQEDGAGATTSANLTNTASVGKTSSSGYTRTSYSGSTQDPTGATTESSAATVTRGRASYHSTTTTTTNAAAIETTTTEATTRSRVSTAAGPTTTATSENITQTTSTTSAGTVTRTTYATAASGAIVAPVSLIGITEAGATEQGWDVTADTVSAGYPEHIAETFTKRTATLTTSSRDFPTVNSEDSYASTVEVAVGVVNLTLTTTYTRTTADTYCPFASVYPATATSTRNFTLLSTSTTTLFKGSSWQTFATTIEGEATNHDSALVTVAEMFTQTVSVTYNLSPTSTSTASLHVAWLSTTGRTILREPRHNLSGSDATSSNPAATIVTEGVTDTTLATTAVTTATDTFTDTATSFAGSQFHEDTCNIPAPGVDSTSTSGEVMPGYTTVESYSTIHNATTVTVTDTDVTLTSTASSTTSALTGIDGTFTTSDSGFGVDGDTSYSTSSTTSQFANSFTITGSTSALYLSTETALSGTHTEITESWYWTTVSRTETSTESTTATTDGTTETTITTTVSGTFYVETESACGSTVTVPELHPQVTFTASAECTGFQMHPRQGFAHPLGLSATDALFSAMSLSPAATVYLPPAGIQDDSSGARAPIANTAVSMSTNGASIYSAVWRTSNSRLAWSSATTATFTTTQQHGTTTATLTRTSTAATATGTASFSGVGVQSWYAPQLSSATSLNSRIAGLAQRSEYRGALVTPPGVRHLTHQIDGTSTSSATSWLKTPSLSTGDGYALPMQDESVWSVTHEETSWSYGATMSLTGEVARPMLTLSLHPDL